MRTTIIAVWVGFLSLAATAGGQTPTANGSVVDAMAYAGDAAAQAAWRPMAGSGPVSMMQIDGRPALKMPCNFQGAQIERASWDRAVRLDMSSCRALRFRLFCRDSLPIANFVIYLQSGNGWYTASFAPSRADGWNTITVNREETRIEGTPAGWSAIRTIRISAWRGKDQDTEFAISDLALVGDRAEVCIIRDESVARSSPGEVDSVNQFSRAMGATLRDLALDYSIISDVDLTAARLKDVRLVILPHNPSMTAAATQAIRSYLENKGKVLAFYTLPADLRDASGIELGRHVSAKTPGQFSSIHFAEPLLAGAPPVVQQKSWNIHDARPLPGRGRILANWFDADGNSTGYPALVASDNCIFMTHVMLGDDAANKGRMLLAMAGQLVPDLWAKSARGILQQAGQFGPYADWAQAAKAIAEQGRERSAQTLNDAEASRKSAEDLLAAGKFAEAIHAAQQAQHLLLESYCLAQSPQADEQRGFWCHSAFGPAGMTWDQSIRILADNGFNAVFPNMLWGGVGYYDSSVLPVAPEIKERGDQIAQCVAACRKYGVACHVWKVNWNMGGRAPREFAQRMKRDGRTQVKFDGSPNDTWLCPSNPENQKLEIDAMVEVASKYDVDGIHFDYIRYPDANGCFCAGCRERFEKGIGHAVKNWPADVRRDPELAGKWLDFRRENITRVVAAVAETVHKIKPKVKISAAVFSNWAVDRDGVGQDWKLWCERGYVDFVCPMDYTPHNVVFENLIRRQIDWAGKTPVYPGIGLSTWGASSENLIGLMEKINITRKLGTHGFTIFEYQAGNSQDIVPMCGKGITRKPVKASVPEERAVEYRIEKLADRPDMMDEVDRVHNSAWPRFVLEGHSPDGAVEKWYPLLERFAEFQLLMTDGEGRLVAAGHTIPLEWDGTIAGLPAGWAGTVNAGFAAKAESRPPTALAALGIAVWPERRGKGVAVEMLLGMKRLAAERGFDSLIAPVRPSWKHRYPLTPMERYVQWKRADGELFDPWIRAHAKIGATPMAVAERSMTIGGTVGEWELWTGMALPESGAYVVPGALVPVRIDRERDEGIYEEPNYWMRHPVGG